MKHECICCSIIVRLPRKACSLDSHVINIWGKADGGKQDKAEKEILASIWSQLETSVSPILWGFWANFHHDIGPAFETRLFAPSSQSGWPVNHELSSALRWGSCSRTSWSRYFPFGGGRLVREGELWVVISQHPPLAGSLVYQLARVWVGTNSFHYRHHDKDIEVGFLKRT